MTDNEADKMPLTIEKARLNLWNIGTALIGIAFTAFGWGITYTTMRYEIAELKKSDEKKEPRLERLERELPKFDITDLKIERLIEVTTNNSRNIQATNERLSNIVENQSGKLDVIVNRISELTTEVRVVQSQLKENAQLNKTVFPISIREGQ